MRETTTEAERLTLQTGKRRQERPDAGVNFSACWVSGLADTRVRSQIEGWPPLAIPLVRRGPEPLRQGAGPLRLQSGRSSGPGSVKYPERRR